MRYANYGVPDWEPGQRGRAAMRAHLRGRDPSDLLDYGIVPGDVLLANGFTYSQEECELGWGTLEASRRAVTDREEAMVAAIDAFDTYQAAVLNEASNRKVATALMVLRRRAANAGVSVEELQRQYGL